MEDLFGAPRHAGVPRSAMRDVVDWARGAVPGRPAAGRVCWTGRLAVDIDLFSRGGLRVLDKIERQDYDVLSRRPAVSKAERVGLLLGALARRAFAQGGVMDALDESYGYCRRVARSARQEFLLLVRAARAGSSATPCAPSTPSCAIATT